MSRPYMLYVGTCLLAAASPGCGGDSNSTQNPGLLTVDCTSKSNEFDNACLYADSLPARTFGKGPAYKDLSRTPLGLFGGYTDAAANAIVTVGSWDDFNANKAYIVKINADTGDRTIISGTYEDPSTGDKTVGTGAAFKRTYDVRPAPNGKLYVVQHDDATNNTDILSVDPATGNRTLVWSTYNTYMTPAACNTTPNGKPSLTLLQPNSLAVNATSIYIGIPGDTLQNQGVGIAEIKIDGSACKILTLSGNLQTGGINPGGGPAFNSGKPSGLQLANGKLYYVFSQDSDSELVSVDLTTGDRARVSADNLGKGDTVLTDWMVLDSAKNQAYTFNKYDSSVKVDLASGDRQRLAMTHNVGGINAPTTALLHPTKPLLFLLKRGIVSIYDPAVGNANTFSW